MNRLLALLLGLGLLGGAVYCTNDLLDLQRHGMRTTGTVIDAVTRHRVSIGNRGIESSDNNSGTIEFTPDGGKPVRFSTQFWSRQKVGREVTVLYERVDPSHAKVDTWSNWLLPGLLALFGAICLGIAFGWVSDDDVQTDQRWFSYTWKD